MERKPRIKRTKEQIARDKTIGVRILQPSAESAPTYPERRPTHIAKAVISQLKRSTGNNELLYFQAWIHREPVEGEPEKPKTVKEFCQVSRSSCWKLSEADYKRWRAAVRVTELRASDNDPYEYRARPVAPQPTGRVDIRLDEFNELKPYLMLDKVEFETNVAEDEALRAQIPALVKMVGVRLAENQS